MENKKLITIAKTNIWQAVRDYSAHTDVTDVLDNISEDFVRQLAIDSVNAKADLRALFAASPAWNEELQAIVINGSRTHNPDYNLIRSLAREILCPVIYSVDFDTRDKIQRAILFFSNPSGDSDDYIQAIKDLAPKAYAPNKKPSRIFKALCDALGVTNNSAGSLFQKHFAQLADELSACNFPTTKSPKSRAYAISPSTERIPPHFSGAVRHSIRLLCKVGKSVVAYSDFARIKLPWTPSYCAAESFLIRELTREVLSFMMLVLTSTSPRYSFQISVSTVNSDWR